MKWLFKASKKSFAIDVGSNTIKVAEFSIKKKKEICLENFTFFDVPEGCIEQGDLIEVDSLREPLFEFMSHAIEKPAPPLCVAIGGRSLYFKKIEILNSDKEVMDSLVHEEVAQHLPFNMDEINYDYVELKSLNSIKEGKVKILLIAAKSDATYNVNHLIEEGGYKCAFIDTASFAILDCVQVIEPDIKDIDESILVLDIGKSGTNFIVIHRDELIFSRYMTVGSDFYTVSLMKEMNIEYQEAESLKISWCSGSEVPPEVNRIMEENNRQFSDEIFLGCEYFKNQFPDEVLLRGYLTGGGSKITNLVNIVGEKFDIPFSVLDPFKTLQSSDFLQDSLEHIKHFVPVTMGLCLKGISK